MWPLLRLGGKTGTEREAAIIANLSARVGSIGDNRLGGWHSYRASKTALNQCIYNMTFPTFSCLEVKFISSYNTRALCVKNFFFSDQSFT